MDRSAGVDVTARVRIEWERSDAPRAEIVETFPNARGEWVPAGELTEEDLAAMRPDLYAAAIVAVIAHVQPRRGPAFSEAA